VATADDISEKPTPLSAIYLLTLVFFICFR
jgi:hypothetical protein